MNELPGFSGPNRDFYAILLIERDSDLKTIQKAYKKLALKYHPDKTTDPEATEKFQTIKRAYDVLSDPKKRKIYDEYGEKGVSMVESMGEVAPFIDPDIIFFLNWVFFIFSCFAALLILFPTFISLKDDGSINWPWVNVFIPAFIIDAVILLALLMRPTDVHPEDMEEHDLSSEVDDEATATGSDSKPKKSTKMLNVIMKWTSIVSFCLVIAFQALLAVKLDGTFDYSWWRVFIPLLVLELANFFDMLHTVSANLKKGYIDFTLDQYGNHEMVSVSYTFLEKLALILDSSGMWLLRVLQIILICLRLESQLTSSWALIFVPTWLWGFVKLSSIILMANDITLRPSKRVMLNSSIVAFVISSLFIYITFGLLVKRLDNGDGSPKASVILIPVFIITGTLFLCLGCCLPCITMGARMALQEELKSSNQERISVERRIEAGDGRK